MGVPIPKPSFKRRAPKRGARTKITAKVREEVLSRSEGRCERCGRSQAYAFEMCHLDQASHGGPGNDPANIVLLCGPSVNTGTCHNFADYSSSGRDWRMKKRQELLEYYDKN